MLRTTTSVLALLAVLTYGAHGQTAEQKQPETNAQTEQPAGQSAEQPVEQPAAEAAPAEGTPVEGQIFEQSADTFLASSFIGTDVVSPEGEAVGEVSDIIMSADGNVQGVVLGVGGFLGIGEKSVAIELSKFDVKQDAETGALTFTLNAKAAELEAAPEFKTQAVVRAEQAAARATQDAQSATTGAAPADPAAPKQDN